LAPKPNQQQAPRKRQCPIDLLVRNAGCGCERPGFEKIKIAPKDTSRFFIRERLPEKQIEHYVGSATSEFAESEARTANG
jgi:hypothetical protein